MRYVLGSIGMLFLLIFAIILFARMGNDNNPNTQIGERAVKLTDYANDKSEVRFTQYGSIVAEENRRVLTITVSQKQRVLEIKQGYQNTPLSVETLSNNPEAYSAFINALDLAGFTNKKVTRIDNEEGSCAQGQRYTYLLVSESKDVSRLWNSSCSPLSGTLGNNGRTIRTLFQAQIPDYNTQVNGVKF